MLHYLLACLEKTPYRHITDSNGFSLIELLVVVAILAILAAVAIPTFLNQKNKARQGVLTADARNAGGNLASIATGYPPSNPQQILWNQSAGTFTVGTETVPNPVTAGTSLSVEGDTSSWCVTAANTIGQFSTFSSTGRADGCLPTSPALNPATWGNYPLGAIPTPVTVTAGGNQGTVFNKLTPTFGTNTFVDVAGPYNRISRVWQATAGNPSPTEGAGWVSTGWSSIDKTKTYRASVWVKRTSLTAASGTIYFGTRGNSTGILNRGTGAVVSNSYHCGFAASNLPADEWALLVAYMWPVGSGTGSLNPDSGLYTKSGSSWNKAPGWVADYVWQDTNTQAYNSTFNTYSSVPGMTILFYGPRFDVVDGSEPTVAELLTGENT